MRRWIWLWIGLLVPWGAVAQDFGVWEYSHDTHASMDKINRYIYRRIASLLFSRPAEKLPWVKAVEHQTHCATPHQGLVGGVKRDYILPQPSLPLSAEMTQRVQQWQHLLRKNPVLHFFTFKTIRPQDIAALSPQEVQQVQRFLAAPTTVTNPDHSVPPQEIEQYKHYLVRITLSERVHLFVNCYAKEVYLVYNSPVLPHIPLEPLPPKLGGHS